MTDNSLEDYVLNNDEEYNYSKDKRTWLSQIQQNQITTNGWCDINTKDEIIKVSTLVDGYIRSNYKHNSQDMTINTFITKVVQKKISEFYGTIWNTDIFLKLISGGATPQHYIIRRRDIGLSKFVETILEGNADATEIETRQVPASTLELTMTHLCHHKGQEPSPLPCPVRSIHMAQICDDKWDATWIDSFDKKTIFEIILAANYLDIKSLLHLGAAKIATLIKQLDQKEINRIIEEEEQYRREQEAQKAVEMDNNKENNDNDNAQMNDDTDNKDKEDEEEDNDDENDGQFRQMVRAVSINDIDENDNVSDNENDNVIPTLIKQFSTEKINT